MKRKLTVLIIILISCLFYSSVSMAVFSQEDIPSPSDSSFIPLEGTEDGMHCKLLGIRFDLDDEYMPVMIMRFFVENVGDRSSHPRLSFWIETTDSYNTGSGTLLSSISWQHYSNYDRLDSKKYNELKPGEYVTFENAYKLDNFTDPIYVNNTWNDPTERRKYRPNDINNYIVVFSKDTYPAGTVAYVSGGRYVVNKKKKNSAVFDGIDDNNLSKLIIVDTVVIKGVTYDVTEIKANACMNMPNLTQLSIGKNVSKIGKKAFSGCEKLNQIIIKTRNLTEKKIGANAFKTGNKKTIVKCPKGKKEEYAAILSKRGLDKKAKYK